MHDLALVDVEQLRAPAGPEADQDHGLAASSRAAPRDLVELEAYGGQQGGVRAALAVKVAVAYWEDAGEAGRPAAQAKVGAADLELDAKHDAALKAVVAFETAARERVETQ